METKLQKYHKETGIKQAFIAQKVNLTPGAYSKIVRGESMPTLPVAIKIARSLNATVESLWGDSAK